MTGPRGAMTAYHGQKLETVDTVVGSWRHLPLASLEFFIVNVSIMLNPVFDYFHYYLFYFLREDFVK